MTSSSIPNTLVSAATLVPSDALLKCPLTRQSLDGNRWRLGILWALLGLTALLSGCAGERASHAAPTVSPAEARELIERSLPRSVSDRAGWTTDLYAGFTVLGITPNHESICAVVAVIEQESGFHVDPVVPG